MLSVSTRARLAVAALLLAALVFAAFSSALPGSFIWDDRTLIEKNQHIRDLSNVGKVFTQHFLDSSEGTLKVANLYYRPLVTISFMVDHALYGLAPWGYHLTNILLHLLSTLLVYVLARRVLRRRADADPDEDADGRAALRAEAAPWAVAALFAVHPSRVEAVTWVSGRTDVMMAALALASMLLFWRALETPDREVGARRRLVAGAWAAFVCALLCKETVVALAVVVPAMDWFLISRGERERFKRNARWCHRALVVSTAAFIGFRLWYQGRVLGPSSFADMGVGDRALLFLESLGHYVWLVITPYSPNMQVGAYYTPQTASWGLVAAGAAAMAGYGAMLWWTASRGHRVAAFALVLGGAFFAPASNIIPLSVHALVADRFLYVPLLGAALLAGVGLQKVMERPRIGSLVLLLAGLVALSWAGIVNLRSRDYASPLRFWVSELATSPDNPLVQEKLGGVMMERHRYRLAETWFHRSLASLLRRGQPPDKVTERLLKVLDSHLLHTSDHDTAALAGVRRLLSRLVVLAARPAGAAEAVRLMLHEHTVTLDFTDGPMHSALKKKRPVLLSMTGNIHSRLGHDADALAALGRAVAARPRSLAFKMNLALARVRAMDPDGAANLLNQVQQARPDSPKVKSLARLIAGARERVAKLHALGHRAPGAASSDVRVHWLLAELHKATGARHRACKHLFRIIEIEPESRKAWGLLVNELASGGDPRGALKVLAAAKKRFGAEPGLLRLEQRIRAGLKK